MLFQVLWNQFVKFGVCLASLFKSVSMGAVLCSTDLVEEASVASREDWDPGVGRTQLQSDCGVFGCDSAMEAVAFCCTMHVLWRIQRGFFRPARLHHDEEKRLALFQNVHALRLQCRKVCRFGAKHFAAL